MRMQPGDMQKAVGAALRDADCLLATYESVEIPGFPFGSFYCMVEYARCPLNQPSSAAVAALASAPCTRSGRVALCSSTGSQQPSMVQIGMHQLQTNDTSTVHLVKDVLACLGVADSPFV